VHREGEVKGAEEARVRGQGAHVRLLQVFNRQFTESVKTG
jgi:hypothetical protein